MTADVISRATEIADDLLFPHALETDRSDVVPRASLDALAAAGLYGIVGDPSDGGLGADFETFLHVIEILAGGCLSTCFVWIQHHSVVRAVTSTETPALRERWARRMCMGEVRAGIALAGLASGPRRIAAARMGQGWSLTGTAPWVTGWGLIDVLQVAGRDEGDQVVSTLIDARPADGMTVDPPLELVALSSTVTSSAHFNDLRVSDDQVLSIQPLVERLKGDHATLRTHAAMAAGVASRCVALMGATPMADELESVRLRIRTAAPDEMVAVKAAASELAWRAAGALVVATGSRSLIVAEHAQRLAREAMFLLVFGGRPALRDELVALLERRRS